MTDDIRLDAAAVRVLAHPLRSRLLSALRLHGPATATELADRLDTNTGATSYHLRKLESVGLVADTGDGEGKRRLWKAASRSHSWRPTDFAGDDDAETSLGWLTRDYVRIAGDHMQQWMDVEHAWPAEWRDALGISDDVVLVTAAQAREMHDELNAVVARYHRAGADDSDARRISVWQLMHPLEPEQP
jgi:DNA-binding transcriptional ArsR family regulator